MTSSTASPIRVIDAGVAIQTILPILSGTDRCLDLINSWHREMARLIAPEIWLPEVVSVIRQAVYRGWLTEDEARTAVGDVFRLHVEIVPSDEDLCQQALEWASRLTQSKAYDGFYLALAQRMGAEFWTTDERLMNRASQLGVRWVHCLKDHDQI